MGKLLRHFTWIWCIHLLEEILWIEGFLNCLNLIREVSSLLLPNLTCFCLQLSPLSSTLPFAHRVVACLDQLIFPPNQFWHLSHSHKFLPKIDPDFRFLTMLLINLTWLYMPIFVRIYSPCKILEGCARVLSKPFSTPLCLLSYLIVLNCWVVTFHLYIYAHYFYYFWLLIYIWIYYRMLLKRSKAW